jgi:DnaK suppressor protein
MTDVELGQLKKKLLEKRAELEVLLRERSGIEIEQAADPLDQTLGAAQRELEVTTLDRLAEQWRAVAAALKRIEAGDYGICLRCEDDISVKRLKAVPWAPLCLACQERAERDVAEGDAFALPLEWSEGREAVALRAVSRMDEAA